jgi:hypothetical protein
MHIYSHSRLETYQNCSLRFRPLYIKRINAYLGATPEKKEFILIKLPPQDFK